jgi:uncharacterized protein
MVGATHPAGRSVGLAHNEAVATLVESLANMLGYVESFDELRRSDPFVVGTIAVDNSFLDCASLSLASGMPPKVDTATAVLGLADRIGSPWIGEHLAFITATPPHGDPGERCGRDA